MDMELKDALLEYALHIKERGWESGEGIILEYERGIPDFRKWAYACGIMLRAEEILGAVRRKD